MRSMVPDYLRGVPAVTLAVEPWSTSWRPTVKSLGGHHGWTSTTAAACEWPSRPAGGIHRDSLRSADNVLTKGPGGTVARVEGVQIRPCMPTFSDQPEPAIPGASNSQGFRVGRLSGIG